MVKLGIIVIVVLVLLIQSTFIISEGEQGLVLQFGKIERIVQEPGLFFKYPFIQDLAPLEKRILARGISSQGIHNPGQETPHSGHGFTLEDRGAQAIL